MEQQPNTEYTYFSSGNQGPATKPMIYAKISLAKSNDIIYDAPPNSWLIRESRQKGMLNITFKNNTGKIEYARFAFIEDRWKCIPDDRITSTLENSKFQESDKNATQGQCRQLLQAIFNQFPELKQDRLLFPPKEQVSTGYSDYCVSQTDAPTASFNP